MEKQINELLERQAQLRERQTALETSRADADRSGISIQCAANTPTTSTPCVSLHRPRAPRTRSSQMSFTPAPGHHGLWVRQQRKTRARPRATSSPPPPLPVFEISTQNRRRERHQAAADGDTEEGLQEPDRDGTQHIARDDDHRVRTASHVPTRTRKVQ